MSSSVVFDSVTAHALVIYDSLSAKKRPFRPIDTGKVGMYVCGMTVYDYCHIGHARVMVGFDIVVRWLTAIGYQVNYVRNITDIDDKIIDRAIKNGESVTALTTRFIAAMHDDADQLGCLRPTIEPKATDHIQEMLALIDVLADKGLAYQSLTTKCSDTSHDVYYAVDQFPNYGKLSKRSLADMQAGARVDVQEQKKNPFDFVLWKSAKAGEPAWPSKWGEGRPGWHIECSAMANKCLGHTFDIHGGGHDLQFPHHENEIAQSEAATGCTYANNWMHVGFINVDGEKMSKSLGNFFTIRDVITRYHPETIRFFILSSHYRSQVNFSDTALMEAHAALTRLYQALKNADGMLSKSQLSTNQTDEHHGTSDELRSQYNQAFSKAMNDDFNTPKALSVLFAVAKALNIAVNEHNAAKTQALQKTLLDLAGVLNIAQSEPTDFLQLVTGSKAEQSAQTDTKLIDAEHITRLVDERQVAKDNKDYARADAIRDELNACGIELEDGADGTTWRRC